MIMHASINVNDMFCFNRNLIRDSDKTIFERLQREFEAARAAQTHGRFCYNLLSTFAVTNLVKLRLFCFTSQNFVWTQNSGMMDCWQQ